MDEGMYSILQKGLLPNKSSFSFTALVKIALAFLMRVVQTIRGTPHQAPTVNRSLLWMTKPPRPLQLVSTKHLSILRLSSSHIITLTTLQERVQEGKPKILNSDDQSL